MNRLRFTNADNQNDLMMKLHLDNDMDDEDDDDERGSSSSRFA